jgi:hypothetical protein
MKFYTLFRRTEGRAGEAWEPSNKVMLCLPPPPQSLGVTSAIRYTPLLSLSLSLNEWMCSYVEDTLIVRL